MTLTEDQYAAWKRTGRTANETFLQGLDNPGDTARHVSAEQRLTAIEVRIARLESNAVTDHMFPRADHESPLTAEEMAADDADWEDQERQIRQRGIERWSAKVADYCQRNGINVIDSSQASAALKCGFGTAKYRMNQLTDAGYAVEMARKSTNQPRTWQIPASTAIDQAEPA